MSKDPLDELYKHRAASLVREARELEVKKYIADLRKDMPETGANAPQTNTGFSNPASSVLMALIAQGMDSEKANAYVKALDNETLMKLSLIGSQNRDAFLPIMLMASKPSTTPEDIIKLVGSILSITRIQNAGQGGTQPPADTIGTTKLMIDTLSSVYKDMAALNATTSKQISDIKEQTVEQRLEQLQRQMENTKPQDPIEYMRKFQEAANVLGWKTGDSSIELEKLKLEDKRHERETKASKEQNQELLGTIKEVIDGRAGKILERIGGAAATKMEKGGEVITPQTVSIPLPNQVMVQCQNCGGTFPVNNNAREATCTNCGTHLTLQAGPPPAMPIEHSMKPRKRRENIQVQPSKEEGESADK